MNDEAAYYEKRAERLGEDFLYEVHRIAIDASQNPNLGSPIGRYTRPRPLNRFPHWLVYIPIGEGIRIVAVAHPKRKPGYWAERL